MKRTMNDKRNSGRGAARAAAWSLSALLLVSAGCKKDQNPAPIVPGTTTAANGQDPADANLAYADGQPTQVLGQNESYNGQQQAENYYDNGAQGYSNGQAPAPIERRTASRSYSDEYPVDASYDQGYADNGAEYYADQAPPPLPEYDQPPAPAEDDIWTPGYWSYAPTGYYWVPGAWVAAPYAGALWTPPYWGYEGHRYRFHHGYWGRHIGFYGGIDYGFGYVGFGYFGGYWNNDRFYYNRACTHVSPMIRTVYERPVIINNVHYGGPPMNRVAYNGGPNGIMARPRPFEVAAMREQHLPPLAPQVQLRQQAVVNRGSFFAENHGRPAMAVVDHPIMAPRVAQAPPMTRSMFNRGAAPGGVPAEAGRGPQPMGRPGAPPVNGVNPGARGFAGPETRGIQPGVQPGVQPGMQPGRPGFEANRPGVQPGMQPGRPGFEANRPGVQPGVQPGRPGAEMNRPGMPMQPHPMPQEQGRPMPMQQGRPMPQEQGRPMPQEQGRPMPQEQGRPMPQEQGRPMPQQQGRPMPQEQGRNMPAPQRAMPMPQRAPQPAPQPQHMEAPRPMPQPQPQHMEAPRAMPQPQPHVEAPRAAPAPAPHAEAPHAAPAPAPGGGGHPGGGNGHH